MSIDVVQEYDLASELQALHAKVDKLQECFDEATATIGSLLTTFGPMVEQLQGSPIMKMLGL